MNLLDGILNRFLVPSFIVNSMPKAGTNLLAKAVALFPGIRSEGLHMGQSTVDRFGERNDLQAMTVPIGADWPQPISITAVRQSFKRMRAGRYATGHIPFSEEMAGLLAEVGMKALLIIRDPRDIVVSHANYVARKPKHFLRELYLSLSESERLTKSIVGIEQTAPNGVMLLNIRERYEGVIPWLSQPLNYTTYFEKLVGPPGGGSRDIQVQELENIARHLDIRCKSHKIEWIADQLFGGTRTFRKGIIGNWRNHFSAKHKHVFKHLASQLLIDLGYEKNCDW